MAADVAPAQPDPLGAEHPDTIDVIVEIPRGSRNKYEMDHHTGRIRLDRRLFSATVYPADYGFIEHTLADDGDPLDALVLLDDPTFPGCVVEARPVGVLWMRDEKGGDAKLLCVPAGDPRWDRVHELDELPREMLDEIHHFFQVYKTLEPEKISITEGFQGREAAWAEIAASRRRYAERAGR